MLTWKYRGVAIFSAAGLFALKSLGMPDAVSIIGFALCLGAHYVDRFFSAEREEVKINKRIKDMEETLKIVAADVTHVKMAAGIRTTNVLASR